MRGKNRLITITKGMIGLYVVMFFSFIWIIYYNNFCFQTNRELGGVISIVIYAIIYHNFAQLYRAFKIGSFQIGEIVFSQFLAIGLADAFLYVECCLAANRYVSILPIFLTLLVQFIGTVIWAVVAKQSFIKNIKPVSTLLIYGERDCREFQEKLQKKFEHLFSFDQMLNYKECDIEVIRKEIDRYDTIMLYEVTGAMRTPLMEYSIYRDKTLYITPRLADIIIEGFEKRHMIDTPMLKYEYHYRNTGKEITKRIMDIVISVIGLMICSIPMCVVAIAIKLEDGGPVFFLQERCTRDEKVFNILKFRSMKVEAEKDGRPIPCTSEDERITRVGRIIRRFRIDELPQFFNVLHGEMSIVGPRPERIEHVKVYTEGLPEFTYRARVKAGLTGYAQIYGKYNTTPYEKLKLDLMYIENQSIILDLKIILLTFKTIFIPESTEGFSKEKSKLMEKGLISIYGKQ